MKGGSVLSNKGNEQKKRINNNRKNKKINKHNLLSPQSNIQFRLQVNNIFMSLHLES